MDDNKQDLKPELKEIYERIMKTSPQQGAPQPATSTAPSQPLGQPSPQPPPPPLISPASTRETSPSYTTSPFPPPSPEVSQSFTPTPGLGEPVSPPNITTQMPPVKEEEEFQPQPSSFSSIAPRPIRNADSSPFIFSANKQGQSTTTTQASPQAGVQKKGGKAVIFVFIFIFLIVYTVFWLIFFGVLNISSLGLPALQLPFKLPFLQPS